MEHKFPLGSFHRENGTTFSGIPFFPEIFQWNEPKNHVPFTTQPEFPEFFGKWKTPNVTISRREIVTLSRFENRQYWILSYLLFIFPRAREGRV